MRRQDDRRPAPTETLGEWFDRVYCGRPTPRFRRVWEPQAYHAEVFSAGAHGAAQQAWIEINRPVVVGIGGESWTTRSK